MDLLNWILCEFLYSFKNKNGSSSSSINTYQQVKMSDEYTSNLTELNDDVQVQETLFVRKRLQRNLKKLDGVMQTTNLEIQRLHSEQERLRFLMLAEVTTTKDYDEKLPLSVSVKGIYQQIKALDNQINYMFGSVQKMLAAKTYAENYFHAKSSFKITRRVVSDLGFLMGGPHSVERSKTEAQDAIAEMQKIETFIESIYQPFDGKDLIQKDMENENLETNLRDYLAVQIKNNAHAQLQQSPSSSSSSIPVIAPSPILTITTTATPSKMTSASNNDIVPPNVTASINGEESRQTTSSSVRINESGNNKKAATVKRHLPGKVAVAMK